MGLKDFFRNWSKRGDADRLEVAEEELREHDYDHRGLRGDQGRRLHQRQDLGRIRRRAAARSTTSIPSELRVAVVGSGPAGFYAADALLKSEEPVVEVDLIDRLPTPWGLVRLGVAPDHENIKAVSRAFEKTAAKPGFRFFGNVEVGLDRHARRAARALRRGRLHGRRTDRPPARTSPARTCPDRGRPPRSSPGTTAIPTSRTSGSTSTRSASS